MKLKDFLEMNDYYEEITPYIISSDGVRELAIVTDETYNMEIVALSQHEYVYHIDVVLRG